MRVEAGAVVDEFDLPGIGQVVARHTRTKSGDAASWACMFTVVASGNAELAVVHRLTAPTLAEARRSVRNAVEFLAGRAAASLPPGRQRRGSDLGRRFGQPVPSARVELPSPGAEVPCGVVPSFPLPATRPPVDQLPTPLS